MKKAKLICWAVLLLLLGLVAMLWKKFGLLIEVSVVVYLLWRLMWL